LYRGDKDRIPLPLFLFLFRYYGGWAGAGIYISMRQYLFNLKIKKVKSHAANYVLPILIIGAIFAGIFQEKESFYFGFAQNLLSDFILILLTIYFLPKLLNPPKNYNISLGEKATNVKNNNKYKQEIALSIVNIGKEVFTKEAIFWEIFIPLESLEKEDIDEVNSEIEISDELFSRMWRIYGINRAPLFLEQEMLIARITFNIGVLYGSEHAPFKIYYRFRTINGNFPSLENVTQDFLGYGFSMEDYPKVGEFLFTAWHNPMFYTEVDDDRFDG